MPAFTPARVLSAGFHQDVIRPLLGSVSYAAGLLGWGSDVLGYDTDRSMDHGWGPRLSIFVDADEVERITKLVDAGLPEQYRGHEVRFGWDTQEPTHHISVSTLGQWLIGHLGVDAEAGMTTRDWLTTPQQQLLGVVAGEVYADDGRLARVRDALRWYPDDVWYWMLACQWQRLAQEEPFVQRTAEVGDELGSAVVAARLARDMMRLALLTARRYAPYTKWLGAAFARLDNSDRLDQALLQAMAAQTLADREQALSRAYKALARRHNALGLTGPVDESVRQFHDRPAMVLGAARFADAWLAKVQDPWLRELVRLGAIDQFADNSDLLSDPPTYRRLMAVYEE
ncbi:MAG TPA: DUF4037 domain-containing protein [Kribbella sp.]|nr:DUF4037 domain-containing protein [Kribbella sp.]